MSLTDKISSLDKLTSKLIDKVSNQLGKAGYDATFANSGNSMMPNSMSSFSGGFSSGQIGGMQRIAQGGNRIITGNAQMMPDTMFTMTRAEGYYNTIVQAGSGMSREALERQVVDVMKGGITSAGSDARAAEILSRSGIGPRDPRFSTMLHEVRNAARYLNMDNESAAAAVTGMTSGPMSGNLLRTMGVFTTDPNTGKALNTSQVFEQMYGRLTAGRSGKMTEEQVLQSYRSGELGSFLRTSGMSEDQQEMFLQFSLAKSRGETMDLSDDAAMDAMGGAQTAAGNENPNQPSYDLETSRARAATDAEGEYLKGIKAASAALQVLAEHGGRLASVFGSIKTGVETFSGDPVGQGFMNIVGGTMDVIGGAISLLNPFDGGDTGTPVSFARGGGFGGLGGGGFRGRSGASGLGGNSGTSNASAGAGAPQAFSMIHPVSKPNIRAKFGQKHSTDNPETILWPNGHKGVDYAGAEGTPIFAAADGEVIPTETGGEFGNYVKIKHSNGYHTFYAHLSSKAVSRGTVKKGQVIGAMGSTGRATGSHLHLALSTSDSTANAIDPLQYISGAASGMGMAEYNPTQGATGNAQALGSTGAANTTVNADSSMSTDGSTSAVLTLKGDGLGQIGSFADTQSVEAYTAADVYNASTSGAMGTRVKGAPSAKTGDSYVAQDGPVNVHAGEAILSEADASVWRQMQAGGLGASGANVTINLSIAKATDDEAERFAKFVKRYLEKSSMTHNMKRL